MKKSNIHPPCKENKTIQNGINTYQEIFSDICDNEVTIWIKIYWESDKKTLIKCDIKLKNKNILGPGANDRYKLHEVVYCTRSNRLEIRLSSFYTFTRNYYYDYDVDLRGIIIDRNTSLDMWVRSSANQPTCKKTICSTATSGDPDDKDGSIIIGTL